MIGNRDLPDPLSPPDIPSALADSALFNPDDGSGGGGFVVHWLNNKDLSFTSSVDLFMLQLRRFSEQQLDHGTDDPLDAEGSPMKFDFGTTGASSQTVSLLIDGRGLKSTRAHTHPPTTLFNE